MNTSRLFQQLFFIKLESQLKIEAFQLYWHLLRTQSKSLQISLERGEINFKSFSANNIYEWNIDAQTEYNIMNTLQHMTMVAMAYQTSHECSEETIMDILVEGFSGQLKGWDHGLQFSM